jgi:colicin import membrane protein
MARKLKAYRTSLGFFDLAVAAPSMKGALEAWGAKSNLFQRGYAQETSDPAIVAATMAKPGVVLKRAVGSKGAFSERAAPPKDLPAEKSAKPARRERQEERKRSARPGDDGAADEAAIAFESEQRRREDERRRDEAAREERRKRQEAAVAKAETALERARRDHGKRAQSLERERAALDRRSEAEQARWETRKEELEAELRKAREQA